MYQLAPNVIHWSLNGHVRSKGTTRDGVPCDNKERSYTGTKTVTGRVAQKKDDTKPTMTRHLAS